MHDKHMKFPFFRSLQNTRSAFYRYQTQTKRRNSFKICQLLTLVGGSITAIQDKKPEIQKVGEMASLKLLGSNDKLIAQTNAYSGYLNKSYYLEVVKNWVNVGKNFCWASYVSTKVHFHKQIP